MMVRNWYQPTVYHLGGGCLLDEKKVLVKMYSEHVDVFTAVKGGERHSRPQGLSDQCKARWQRAVAWRLSLSPPVTARWQRVGSSSGNIRGGAFHVRARLLLLLLLHTPMSYKHLGRKESCNVIQAFSSSQSPSSVDTCALACVAGRGMSKQPRPQP